MYKKVITPEVRKQALKLNFEAEQTMEYIRDQKETLFELQVKESKLKQEILNLELQISFSNSDLLETIHNLGKLFDWNNDDIEQYKEHINGENIQLGGN